MVWIPNNIHPIAINSNISVPGRFSFQTTTRHDKPHTLSGSVIVNLAPTTSVWPTARQCRRTNSIFFAFCIACLSSSSLASTLHLRKVQSSAKTLCKLNCCCSPHAIWLFGNRAQRIVYLTHTHILCGNSDTFRRCCRFVYRPPLHLCDEHNNLDFRLSSLSNKFALHNTMNRKRVSIYKMVFAERILVTCVLCVLLFVLYCHKIASKIFGPNFSVDFIVSYELRASAMWPSPQNLPLPKLSDFTNTICAKTNGMEFRVLHLAKSDAEILLFEQRFSSKSLTNQRKYLGKMKNLKNNNWEWLITSYFSNLLSSSSFRCNFGVIIPLRVASINFVVVVVVLDER